MEIGWIFEQGKNWVSADYVRNVRNVRNVPSLPSENNNNGVLELRKMRSARQFGEKSGLKTITIMF